MFPIVRRFIYLLLVLGAFVLGKHFIFDLIYPPGKPVTVKEQAPPTVARFISMDKLMEANGDGDIRAWTSLKSEKVGHLKTGSKVKVTGKTTKKGTLWYRIERIGGRPGFVPAEMLSAK